MIKALIYLPAVSRTIAQVKVPGGRVFRRCQAHENLLCLEGRALDLAEFNAVAPKMIHPNLIQQIGSLPCVKLVDVPDVPVPADVSAETTDVTPPKAPAVPESGSGLESLTLGSSVGVTVLPAEVEVEAVEGGFVLADYRSGAAFLGDGDAGWQGDVSLVTPFRTPEVAMAAFGPAPESVAAPAEAPKPAKAKKK